MQKHGDKLRLQPFFVSSEEELNESLRWSKRDAVIKDSIGKVLFEQKDVEFPDFWSDTAVNIVSEKYFKVLDNGEKEHSLRQLVDRVVDTITKCGIQDGYFDIKSAKVFNLDLKYLIYNQYYSFNSPVWFNVGIEKDFQASACFIQSVEDNMKSIMDLARNEALIFKGGSGTGTNLSTLRARGETLRGGGTSSGPVSFMKGLDAFAGVIKSGGRNRRAAKMVILDAEHPDIIEFIESKQVEEEKAKALIGAGYSANFNEENSAYSTVAFQNENHTVRASDLFMRAVKEDSEWEMYGVKNNKLMNKMKAKDLFMRACQCAWSCGDPGFQFSGNINRYHTTPKCGEIRASNACTEILSIDDSACNLGSHNLMRYVSTSNDGFNFDEKTFIYAVMLTALAQEIMIDRASYPTPKITINAKKHRQLGVGYSNLGALIMYCGYPYDSTGGRALASSITSLLTSSVYYMSTLIASIKGSFNAIQGNKEYMGGVLNRHKNNINSLDNHFPKNIISIKEKALEIWDLTLENYDIFGCRNSQATVLAPTGTIGFMMDCDTTGAEPEISLVKNKSLVGGGAIKLINKTVFYALKNLGYDETDVAKILEHISSEQHLSECLAIKKEHLSVFDCSLSAAINGRAIKADGHVKMLAAIQPHISGGISKTVNLPTDATVQDIYDVFMLSYDLGVKAITIYRNNSKDTQPINVGNDSNITTTIINTTTTDEMIRTVRRHLPNERDSVTHKFSIGNYKGYLTVGFFDDKKPGEIFINSAKAGSTMNGLLDCFATSISIALQYGVPIEKLIDKFTHVSFSPQGYTPNRDIGFAHSVVDYVFRYLEKFVKNVDGEKEAGDIDSSISRIIDTPPCPRCGNMMERSGSCYRCRCGESSGGCG